MNSAWSLSPQIALHGGRIAGGEAERQRVTAQALLERLAQRPGVILADEVGMGKTFVALAVSASVAWATGRPAVVMVPPRLVGKWWSEATRFAERCVAASDSGAKPVFRVRRASSGAEFLKCFDDPPERTSHLVIVANNAFHVAERDPWVKLAAIKRSFNHTSDPDDARRVVARFAARLIPSLQSWKLSEADFQQLLSGRVDSWRSRLNGMGHDFEDDPVPMPFIDALTSKHLTDIARTLQAVPRRASDSLDARLVDARKQVSATLADVWRTALGRADIRSPLLIFDEAHHLKNADTRLAKLFQDPNTADTSVISGAFDRMLFLTATPFQLGHGELIEVLHRFRAVRWEALGGDEKAAVFKDDLDALRESLDSAHHRALGLEQAWGRLTPDDVPLTEDGEVSDIAWTALRESAPGVGVRNDVAAAYQAAAEAFRRAEGLLRPWVVRHLRDRMLHLPTEDRHRRVRFTGAAIRDQAPGTRGLVLEGDTKFPFLLCARAQGSLARWSGKRAYFAEGIASSYGAFAETTQEQGRPTDDADTELSMDDPHGEIGWYLREVEQLIGQQRSASSHPKVHATVERALTEWRSGHKVLIFAHYRKTIRDLAAVLKQRVEEECALQCAAALGLPREATVEARARLARVQQRLRDPQSPMHREVKEVLNGWLRDHADLMSEADGIIEVLFRALSEWSFMARNFPLDRAEVRDSLEAEKPTALQARAAATAVAESLQRRRGTGRPSFQSRVRAFLEHLTENYSSPVERQPLLADLASMDLEPVVQANGTVDEATRRRRLAGFNSPLMPEILVASEVMAEGLDLHLECRHIIHHDLSWNPSTLEQRTGRVDRLRCLAEADGESIHIYLPYLEGTADEKMYRVVSDRARWFQVVMGERYQVDEATTELLSRRVPLAVAAAEALMFDLSVADRASSSTGDRETPRRARA